MAWNGDRDGVCGNSAGDSAHRFWLTDTGGDFGVSGGRARWNVAERLPNTLLEGGAANIEGKITGLARLFYETDHPRDQTLEIPIAADQIRLAETALEVLHEFIRIVAKQDGADTFF